MTNITRIMVPTDFSDQADAALDYAVTLAATFAATIDLVHVFIDPVLNLTYVPDAYMPVSAALHDVMCADVATQLRRRAGQAPAGTISTHIITGNPAPAITRHAATHHVDLIVMGTHGRSGVAHLFLGSVAERVVRAAPCPVLTVRGLPATAVVSAVHTSAA